MGLQIARVLIKYLPGFEDDKNKKAGLQAVYTDRSYGQPVISQILGISEVYTTFCGVI